MKQVWVPSSPVLSHLHATWALQVAEPVKPVAPPGCLGGAMGRVHRALVAVERFTGFSRDQLALGMQVSREGASWPQLWRSDWNLRAARVSPIRACLIRTATCPAASSAGVTTLAPLPCP